VTPVTPVAPGQDEQINWIDAPIVTAEGNS
jgi:hypothetical protein